MQQHHRTWGRHVVRQARDDAQRSKSTLIRYLLTGLLALGCPLASRATSAIDLHAWAQSAAISEQALDAASLSEVQRQLLAENTDPELRQGVINVLEQRIGWDIDALGYAWTIDMIARREGKPQRFGTLPEHAFPVALRGVICGATTIIPPKRRWSNW